ncbi:MAG: glycerophosphodiester phosphodiesterase family protein, partial [Wenzhouxiangella sp.]
MTAPASEWLIAHRGWPARHPENSLEGIRAVLAAGARQVEFDVQITADGRPVVVHDDDLRRLAGHGGRVTSMRLKEVTALQLHSGARIPVLERTLAAFDDHPGTTAFVELKRHSIDRLGVRRAVDAVCDRLLGANCDCVFLSFDRRAGALARRRGLERIGWVIRHWSLRERMRALWLRPDYLFVRADRIPAGPHPFWRGRWKWVVYGVDTFDQARDWRDRGATLVETDDLPGLLE